MLYGNHVVMKANKMALSVRAAFFSFAFLSFLRLLISVLALEAKRLATVASFMVIAAGDMSVEEEVAVLGPLGLMLIESGCLSLFFFPFLDFLPSFGDLALTSASELDWSPESPASLLKLSQLLCSASPKSCCGGAEPIGCMANWQKG